ncbi:hypothetical protein [Streptomyces mayteni]
MRTWPARRWIVAAVVATSVLEGLLVATCLRAGDPVPGSNVGTPAPRPRTLRAVVAGVLSAFAVGCPIRNKLVVLALGVSGALSYRAPAQPVLALASIGLLAHALFRRPRTPDACPVPS